MKEFCVDLKIAKELRDAGYPQNSHFKYIEAKTSPYWDGLTLWCPSTEGEIVTDLPEIGYGLLAEEIDGKIVPVETNYDLENDEYDKHLDDMDKKLVNIPHYHMATSEELLKHIPETIVTNNCVYRLILMKYKKVFSVYYVNASNQNEHEVEDKKLSNALAKLWLDLKDRGLL